MWIVLLLVACGAAVVSSARLCLAAVAAAALPEGGSGAAPDGGLGLYETAFLAGGPRRVTDTALVSLAGERRVLLAHTGWVTVVDPQGRDELERSLIAATGPAGQAPVAAVRVALAADGPVHALGDRLADAGLAVPADTRARVAEGIRQVRAATGLIVLAAAAGFGLGASARTPTGAPLVLWFALPLILTSGCWLIARIEVRPYTRWATPSGQQALRTVLADTRPPPLLAVATHGPAALKDPALRAALA